MYDIVKCVLCNYVGLAPQILFSISHIPLALKKNSYMMSMFYIKIVMKQADLG